MNDIDTTRIKEKFYSKLQEEKAVKHKKTRLSVIMAAAAIFSLMGVSVLAANLGVFETLFRNFGEVAPYVQIVGERTESNGITMELTSYLADDNGIVMELRFTRDDGSVFADDVTATGIFGHHSPIDITIGDRFRWSTQQDIVSGDGLTLYSFPMVHFDDIVNVESIPIEISVGRLVYNRDMWRDTVEFDFYSAFRGAEIKTLDFVDNNDFIKLFDNVPDNPVTTEQGVIIHSVVFANVYLAPLEEPTPDMLWADGIDLGGLFEENNIIGIKMFQPNRDGDNREYISSPQGLHGNDDIFNWLGVVDESGATYHFFRVACFEDLANIGGIDFWIEGHNFIEGDWHIETTFSSNKERGRIEINQVIETGHPETTFTLANATISFLSMTLTYEIRDDNGNLRHTDCPFDLNNYFFMAIAREIKLIFSDGSEIPLISSRITMPGAGGLISAVYGIDMNPVNYVLLNTVDLIAIVIDGERFYVDTD